MFDEQQAMTMALNISGNHVVCLDLKDNRVYDLYGEPVFGKNVGIEAYYAGLHPDDLEKFRSTIERMRNGETEAEWHYRWNANVGGQGDPVWIDIHGHALTEFEDGKPVSIITTLNDETEVKRKEREIEQLSERYRSIFENSVIGQSFYSPEGQLLDANRIMRKICNFEDDIAKEFFYKVNLFDMMPFNEVLDREHPDDYWACSESIIPEKNMRVYLEISVHPIYDENGQLIYISVTANDVTEERNMYLKVMENDARMKKMNEAIKNYEAELRYMLEASKMQTWRISLERETLEFYNGLNTVARSFNLSQMLKIFVDQDNEFVKALSNPSEALKEPLIYIGQMHPMVTQSSTEKQWVQINCIPEYDKNGHLLGAFGVWRNISDLMRKQDLLRSETQRAKESGQMKSLFLANMSHEIRTPINAIVGFSEVLSTLTSSEEKKEVIQIIKNNCDMLLRLIDDILTASSLETGEVSIKPIEVDFAKTFNELFESLRPRVQETDVDFIKDNPYPTLTIKVDADRLTQVITNFLTNAVKYTHQGHIKLGYHLETRTMGGEQHKGLYLYCEDTGDGIPLENQPKIFERFYKVNDFIQGTGLGLAICKAFANACHGEIGLISEGIGKGCTFWMWIPL